MLPVDTRMARKVCVYVFCKRRWEVEWWSLPGGVWGSGRELKAYEVRGGKETRRDETRRVCCIGWRGRVGGWPEWSEGLKCRLQMMW